MREPEAKSRWWSYIAVLRATDAVLRSNRCCPQRLSAYPGDSLLWWRDRRGGGHATDARRQRPSTVASAGRRSKRRRAVRDRRWSGLVLAGRTRLLSRARCRALWTVSIDATDAGSRARWTCLSKANSTVGFEHAGDTWHAEVRRTRHCSVCRLGVAASVTLDRGITASGFSIRYK
jgi:hypothetical protein